MKNIRLSKCSLGNEEIKSVSKILKSDFLGMGPNVLKFEKILSNFFKRKAVCVSSGTSALHIALESLGLKKGDEVILSSLNYIAALQAVTAAGLTPVLCDIRLSDFSLCTNDLKKKLTKKTRVIMPTHYGGNAGNIDEIYKIAKLKKIRVIEDAAHAFNSFNKRKLIGSFGDICCFSFDGIKNITSGEGGCIVSSDKKIIKLSKEIRFLSIEKESENRYLKKKQFSFDVKRQGWRYHMSDIMAAIGIEQFYKINKFSRRRKQIAKIYSKKFQNNENIELLEIDYSLTTPHIFVIKLKKKFNRLKLTKWFKKFNIEIGFHWKPLHELSFFKKNFKSKNLNNTNYIKDKIITVPIHVDLSDRDINFVCKKVSQFTYGR